jgi:hypothetical protein
MRQAFLLTALFLFGVPAAASYDQYLENQEVSLGGDGLIRFRSDGKILEEKAYYLYKDGTHARIWPKSDRKKLYLIQVRRAEEELRHVSETRHVRTEEDHSFIGERTEWFRSVTTEFIAGEPSERVVCDAGITTRRITLRGVSNKTFDCVLVNRETCRALRRALDGKAGLEQALAVEGRMLAQFRSLQAGLSEKRKGEERKLLASYYLMSGQPVALSERSLAGKGMGSSDPEERGRAEELILRHAAETNREHCRIFPEIRRPLAPAAPEPTGLDAR